MDSVKNRKSPSDKLLESEVCSQGKKQISIFMIVNPVSGSNEGVAYTELGETEFSFTMQNDIKVDLKITNLLNEENVEMVKEDVQNALNSNKNSKGSDLSNSHERLVVILICAGDGTFMNIAQEFKEYGIKIESLVFAVFPFGTANDISRNCGWGVVPSDHMLESIEYVCELIINSKESGFDVWEVEIHTREDGDIHKPKDGVLVSMETTYLSKFMCHSFSFGSDARTGLAFERKRTRNRVCNRIRYGYEGFKNFIRCWGERTMKIKELIKSFNKIKIKNDSELLGENNNPDEKEESKMVRSAEIEKKIIVASTKEVEADNYLINNPVSFYCLNLPSIMNGNINLWSGGRNSIGYQDEDGIRATGHVYNHQPAFDDGMLEFATFDSLLYYILNKSNSIIQDEGPFEFEFVDDEDTRTFLNIDGEFYKAFNISKVRITKGTRLCKNGSLRVLVNENTF